ncbi:MAG: hypothetical protein WCR33_02190, partial [Bacilli bacterium]
MIYLEESIFTREKLSTSLSRTDLIEAMKKKDNNKKEMEDFITIINNKDRLFDEELFTESTDNEKVQEHTELIKQLRKFNWRSDIYEIMNVFASWIKFKNAKASWKDFYFVPDDEHQLEKKINDFKNCIFNHLARLIDQKLRMAKNGPRVASFIENIMEKVGSYDDIIVQNMLIEQFTPFIVKDKYINKALYNYYTSMTLFLNRDEKAREENSQELLHMYSIFSSILNGRKIAKESLAVCTIISKYTDLFNIGEYDIKLEDYDNEYLKEIYQKIGYICEDEYKYFENNIKKALHKLIPILDMIEINGIIWLKDYMPAMRRINNKCSIDDMYNYLSKIVNGRQTEINYPFFASTIINNTQYKQKFQKVSKWLDDASKKGYQDSPFEIEQFLSMYWSLWHLDNEEAVY